MWCVFKKVSQISMQSHHLVTSPFYEVVLEDEWARQYYLSDINSRAYSQGYGTCILSKHPMKSLKRFSFPSYMGRDLLVAQYQVWPPASPQHLGKWSSPCLRYSTFGELEPSWFEERTIRESRELTFSFPQLPLSWRLQLWRWHQLSPTRKKST